MAAQKNLDELTDRHASKQQPPPKSWGTKTKKINKNIKSVVSFNHKLCVEKVNSQVLHLFTTSSKTTVLICKTNPSCTPQFSLPLVFVGQFLFIKTTLKTKYGLGKRPQVVNFHDFYEHFMPCFKIYENLLKFKIFMILCRQKGWFSI